MSQSPEDPDAPKKPDWEHVHWRLSEPPSETVWDRVLSYSALTILLTIGCAIGAFLEPYFRHGRTSSHFWLADHDTKLEMLIRLVAGAVFGAIFSIALIAGGNKSKNK
jgi:hypothetical protein